MSTVEELIHQLGGVYGWSIAYDPPIQAGPHNAIRSAMLGCAHSASEALHKLQGHAHRNMRHCIIYVREFPTRILLEYWRGGRPVLSTMEYAEKNGVVCPVCRSSELNESTTETGDYGVTVDVTCRACGSTWTDVYGLTGYCNLVDNTRYDRHQDDLIERAYI